nr:FKBP-type peptidyl-prolyl cis-trans isomerase [Solirubrobacter soli]
MAFDLPPVDRCITHRTLTFHAEHVTARVDGQPFKRIHQRGRTVRLRFLPRGHHTLELKADGKTVRRPYQTCLDTRPAIAKPTGDPPTTLQTKDLAVGSIRRARSGDTVTVQYSLVTWSDGREVDSSWDRGEPFAFALGKGQVIEGFDRGIAGMKVGGRRELIVPPDLGYGDQGAGDAINPGETLVFVVDLVAID